MKISNRWNGPKMRLPRKLKKQLGKLVPRAPLGRIARGGAHGARNARAAARLEARKADAE